MPKNTGPQPAFGRSILVLTPQRALKFTATTQERHYIWLTALSFLSHSASAMEEIAMARSLPQQEYPAIPVGGGLRRNPIRDSIRVAKGRPRPTLNGRSYTSPFSSDRGPPIQDAGSPILDIDEESDAAEPPHVPRVAGHSRKRSNTGPRPLMTNAFHSFPTHGAQTSTLSLQDAPVRESYSVPYAGTALVGGKRSTNHHNAEIRNLPPPVVRNNFFDAVGTVRMEAFIDSEEERQNGYTQSSSNKKERLSYRTRHGRKKDMSYWGVGVSAGSEMMTQ